MKKASSPRRKSTPKDHTKPRIDPELHAVYLELDNKKADEIVVLDLEDKSSIARYFVIATATGPTHLSAIIFALQKLWKEKFSKHLHTHSRKESAWQIADTGEVMVHLFTQEERARYNLEGLWGDAKQLKISA